MQSKAKTVQAFLDSQPEPVRTALASLREIVRREAPMAVESMKYGMPVYCIRGGIMLCGFNAQKQGLAFYVGRVPDAFRAQMRSGFSLGKGCIRFRSLTPERAAVLQELLREVVAKGITCA